MKITWRTTLPAALVLTLLSWAPAAQAGELAVEAHGGLFVMSASNSASALFDSDQGPTFGGAARYTFWRGAFAAAGARTFSKEGERVFVAAPNAPVQKLGFPLSLRITPIFAVVGYRFRHGSLVVPYVQAGATLTSFSETSSVAGQDFDQSGSHAGFVAGAGVEVGRGLLRFAAEAGWSTVPDAIGKDAATDLGGVAKVYGDDDLGGRYVIAKLVLAFDR